MGSNSELNTKNFWKIVLNSTSGFVLAFMFVFYLNHFITIISASLFSYDVGFDYLTVVFNIEPYEWTPDAVKLIFSAGSIMIFIAGFIALIAYISLFEEEAIIKIFFLWLFLLAINYSFGGLMIGNIFKKGVGHVFNWMYLTDTQKMIIAIIGFFGLLTTGILMAKPVAYSANSYFKNFDENKFPYFFTAQIILPFIFGNFIAFAFFYPDIIFNADILFYERFGWISLGLILLIIFGRMNHLETLYFEEEEERTIRISPTLVVSAIVVALAFRLILSRTYLISW